MKQIDKTLQKVLSDLLAKRRFNVISDLLLSMNPADAGIFLNEVSRKQLFDVFKTIPVGNQGLLFVELDDERQVDVVEKMSDSNLSTLLDSLYIDDLIDLVKALDESEQTRVRMLLAPDKASQLGLLMSYDIDSIGGLMNTSFISFRPNQSIKDAVDYIRVAGLGKETVNVCYVTDSSRHLLGVVGLRSLITAPDDRQSVMSIMDSMPISVNVNDDKEAVSITFGKYDLTVIPVVDGQNHLMGIVTVDDVLDVVQEEATEDIQKMAAIIPSESVKPYLRTSVWRIWRVRIPWLLVLMIGATFTAKVITAFEGALSSCVILTAFIPMLMDTAGNSGSQASVTVVRGIALGELKFCDVFKVLWKELCVAILCGLCLILFNFAKLMLIDKVSLMVALSVCSSLFMAVIISKLMGALLPLVIGRIGLDPAVMAGPILTTIVDALTLIIYFSTATKLMKLL